jgi:hypothetical protein
MSGDGFFLGTASPAYTGICPATPAPSSTRTMVDTACSLDVEHTATGTPAAIASPTSLRRAAQPSAGEEEGRGEWGLTREVERPTSRWGLRSDLFLIIDSPRKWDGTGVAGLTAPRPAAAEAPLSRSSA